MARKSSNSGGQTSLSPTSCFLTSTASQLLRRLKEIDPSPEIIVISGQGTIARAVEAGQAGAFFFLEKPVSQEGLDEHSRPRDRPTQERAEHQQLKDQIRGQYSFANIVGQSKKMKELFELVESVAASDANILIQGENGTGKELIANAIHYNSNRVKGPFIKINCAAIPKDLIESELFGYKKGAFTGANMRQGRPVRDGRGRLAAARRNRRDAPYLQTKLLRVLQEREYRPIGSDRLVRVDFRLICATNIDLETALREGKLREDLYFRINTITLPRAAGARAKRGHSAPLQPLPIEVQPALSEERAGRSRRRPITCSSATAGLATFASWRTQSSAPCWSARRGEITPNDLPETIREEGSPTQDFTIPPHRTLAEIEKMAIVQTLQRTNWNKQEAAQILGLYRPTLYSKMKKHDIKDQRAAQRAAAASSTPRRQLGSQLSTRDPPQGRPRGPAVAQRPGMTEAARSP